MTVLAYASAGLALGMWIAAAWIGYFGARRLRALTPDFPDSVTPSVSAVSAIVPARNEAAALPRALPTLLRSRYAALEVIAVDDRSTDDTPTILDRLASQDSRLAVLHVAQVPNGWLGKTHALYAGYAQSHGEWLLFTDADVVFHPDCIRAAVAYAERERLDHLVVLPHVETVGFWEPILVGCFGLLFGLLLRPWAARNPRSRAFIGVGAFNLVRRRVYDAIGTHESLANAVVDDIQLGAAVKANGFRQEAVLGGEFLSVRWQIGLSGIVRGLEKNAYAGLRYSVAWATVACAVLLLAGTAPAILCLVGEARSIWGAAALAGIACQAYHAREARLPLWSAMFQPFGFAVLAYTIARSAVLARVRGRIEWRGTAYELPELQGANAGNGVHLGRRNCWQVDRTRRTKKDTV